ncbi:MAG: hypothetical protein E7313_06550 [Clostridiales bacterium]|nr:hypothetical protein [Clostridiales bacterium]
MEKEYLIHKKPVIKIIEDIENSTNKSILLAGGISSGKTTVLNELLNTNSNNSYIDVSVNAEEYVHYADEEIYNLAHVCLIVKKMINFIKEKNKKEYFHFISLDRLVSFIYTNINYMYVTDSYSNKKDKIDIYILKNPEVLIEEFISIISLDIKSIRLVIDNFDSIAKSSKRYQIFIYNLLKKYLTFIVTVSDMTVLSNEERKNDLKRDNELIEVNYNVNVEDVKKIIEINFSNEKRRFGNNKVITNVNFILSDEEIELIIEKTNGNLFDILRAFRFLYININSIKREEYLLFICNYIDKEININPIFSGKVVPERILHIK